MTPLPFLLYSSHCSNLKKSYCSKTMIGIMETARFDYASVVGKLCAAGSLRSRITFAHKTVFVQGYSTHFF